ncbi:MAG: FtsX-like permease family protein [Anaerolineae bacterium]|nr:FtsX-like permease family protein [Anaerolineae bacterium]MDK1081603.1 FtsX-like permease family protein [Anaerolineae bacterium]MDK1117778.1 FtsX-like permease family protein [Anaerolineae bacterium]
MSAFSRGTRNVYRNKPRGLVLILILALSVGLFVGLSQATRALTTQTKNLTRILENTIEVRNAGATGMGQGVELIPEQDVVGVKTVEHISQIEKQLLVRNVYSEYFPTISITTGNEPGKPLRVATHGEPAAVRIIAGRDFTEQDQGQNVAIIGQVYAENRDLTVGATFLEPGGEKAQAGGQELEAVITEIEVVGIFTSNFAFGDNQVFLPLKTAQRIYGLDGGISVLWVTVDEIGNVEAVETALRDEFGGTRDVLTGQSKVRFVSQSFDRILVIGKISLLLSLFVGALVVIFTMVLTTQERIKEIGVLKALGASNWEVAFQFIVETSTLVLVGSVLGLASYSTIGPTLINSLLGLDTQTGIQPGIEMGLAPVSSLVSIEYTLQPSVIVLTLLATLAFAVLGSLYPIWRALSLPPAEALRYE